ncbi:LysR family transcriptional regulator [Achromobacter denitrificans]|uniref:LysR family transcriptional regulator n=1 Tax=Achromobacter denitrificans TaxID=32002 RepID=UPI003D084FAE
MSSIRVFRSFVATAAHGSFAAASEQVSLTPAAVGLQIQTLEKDLGYTVFDRVGRSIVLNQRGHRLLPKARQLLALYEDMHNLELEQTELAGTVKMACIATAMGMVVRAVLRIREIHPRLNIEPGISYSGMLVSRIKEGDIDAAVSVRGAHKLPADVLYTQLYREPLVFIVNARTPRADPREILAQRLFLQVSRSSNTGTLIDEFMRRLHLRANDALEMNAMRTIIDMVKEDLGVTLLPLPRGTDWDRDPDLRIEYFDDPQAFRNIGLFESENRGFLTSVLREQLLALLAPRGSAASG